MKSIIGWAMLIVPCIALMVIGLFNIASDWAIFAIVLPGMVVLIIYVTTALKWIND